MCFVLIRQVRSQKTVCVSVKWLKAKAYDEEKMPDLNRMIGDFAKGMDADNSTMHAMQEHFTEHSDKVPEKVTPFTSAAKYSGVHFRRGRHMCLEHRNSSCVMIMIKYKEEIEGYTSRETVCWYSVRMTENWTEKH